jgi:hypothetical protein
MSRRLSLLALPGLVLLAISWPSPAAAQPLGTFRWQFQPYCNVVAVTVVQQGAQYQLDGTDDQCGAGQRASVTGLAFLNPDGSIGFGLSIVTTPGGAPVQVDASIALATLSGTWRDSTGATGAFVFTPGTAVPGRARPVPTRGDVTAVTAGPGLTGGGSTGDLSLAVDFAATQQRVTGSCATGQLMTGVNQNGTVSCQSVTGAGGGDITAVSPGPGLTGGGPTGDVTLSAAFGGPGTANTIARSDHTHAVNAPALQNVGVGPLALQRAVEPDGGGNVAVGQEALRDDTTGWLNTAVGFVALRANTVGFGLTAVGAAALRGNTTGTFNTALGYQSLLYTSTGRYNTAIGADALLSNLTGSFGTAVGGGALRASTAGGNSAFGYQALTANTTGTANTAVGQMALRSNTTAWFNTAVGHFAMELTTTGEANTAIGGGALGFNTTGSENTAIGTAALGTNDTAGGNTAVGRAALSSNIGGAFNTALGLRALDTNVSGSNNTAVGAGTMNTATSGNYNTAVGLSALPELTTGSENIGIGFNAGIALTTGSNNIYVGGYAGSASESNTIRIGSGQTATYAAGISGATSSSGIPVLINGAGRLGTATSSARFKQDISPLGESLTTRVQGLRPVRFYYAPEFDDGSRQVQYGLIAEEVAETFPELLVRDADGRPQTVRYHLLTPLLLAEVQRLEQARATSEAAREALEGRVRALESALTTLLDRAKH